MHHFNYKEKELFCENIPLSHIAKEVGTPFYVYPSSVFNGTTLARRDIQPKTGNIYPAAKHGRKFFSLFCASSSYISLQNNNPVCYFGL
ncbi:MAG: hypothetical protein B1H11_12470 [Desulfobacteraceae bacterium 4484_190.1]|nr:MAG: hypothetical protein B1H11_12470 [Desulfobacteraceae bacterium 4484_190.1]